MEHTKGPWRWFDEGELGSTQPLDALPLRDKTILRLREDWIRGVSTANASLIEAAPDLLQALELAEATIMRLNRHNSADGTLDVVRTAIAKARGK